MKLKKKFALLGMYLILDVGVVSRGKTSADINVISIEQGSGARAGFIEITGILNKKDGNKIDETS